MVKHAFMACGARNLCLTTLDFDKNTALSLYEEASQRILDSVQNPNRNSAICAAAAVVLSVYEVMSPTITNDMNHTAGARALIRECGWDAKTPGIGGSCFWTSVITELLSCLHFNSAMSWDPDAWGVDMNMDAPSSKIAGDEEFWIYRIVYICAKISNLRSSACHMQMNHQEANIHLNQRCQEWDKLTDLCERWREAVPRSMAPLSYIPFPDTSALPQFWYVFFLNALLDILAY